MSTRTIAALILAVLTGTVAAAFDQDRPLAPLEILIKDIYGRDLASARIQIVDNRTGTKIDTVSDENGRAFAWVTPGSHRIAVSLAGYGNLIVHRFCVIEGEPARFSAALGLDRGRPQAPQKSGPVDIVAPRTISSATVLSAAEVREAMEFGRKSRKLTGYRLTASGALERSNVGLLFTAFLRVATMTQVADATKKQFADSEIPRSLLERVAWIALTATEHADDDEDRRQRYMAPPTDVVIEPKGDRDSQKAIPPVWKARLDTACDSEVYESILGRQFPWPGMVAAFPMDVLQEGHVIAVTFSTTATLAGGFHFIKIPARTKRVRIQPKDLHDWR